MRTVEVSTCLSTCFISKATRPNSLYKANNRQQTDKSRRDKQFVCISYHIISALSTIILIMIAITGKNNEL